MIVLLEPPEGWSLMMLTTAVAIDNARLSPEGAEAIRRWRSEMDEKSDGVAALTETINGSLNQQIDAKLMRRIKTRGYRAETVRK